MSQDKQIETKKAAFIPITKSFQLNTEGGLKKELPLSASHDLLKQ